MDICLSYYNHPNVIKGYIDWHFSSGGSNACVFRLLLQRLLDSQVPYKGGVLVDLCSGPGTSISQLCQLGFGTYYGFDGAPNMVSELVLFAEKNKIPVKAVCLDFQLKPVIPVDPNTADVVSLCSGIMYFKNVEYFFYEAARILKKNGVFAVNFLVKADEESKSSYFIDPDNICTYLHSDTDILEAAAYSGFEISERFSVDVEEMAPNGLFFHEVSYLFRKL